MELVDLIVEFYIKLDFILNIIIYIKSIKIFKSLLIQLKSNKIT